MAEDKNKRTFPYAFARVSAMKAKLIKPDDYHKLLKMDLPSITRYLQDTQYRDSITKLSSEFSGMELMDRALRRSEILTYKKLRKICPNDVVEVIDLYLTRGDFQNLKVVLRGLYSNAAREEVLPLLEPIGKYGRKHFETLFETGSCQKALLQSKIVSEKEIKEEYEAYRQSNKLIELENRLDHIFYTKAMEGAKSLSDHGDAFKKFLLRDIDVLNIRNLLRFKQEGVPIDEIEKLLIIEGLRLNRNKLHSLAKKDTVESLLTALSKTYYAKYVDFEGDIVAIELQLKKFHLKQAFVTSRRNPLSISTILGYMIRKLIEIKNLRSLIKSKHLGIDADYVEKNLLVI